MISEVDIRDMWPDHIVHPVYNGVKVGTPEWVRQQEAKSAVGLIGRLTPDGEKDPNGKQPNEPGAKLDAGKPPVYQGVLDYFPRALMAVAEISAKGAEKYAWKGWETVPDGVNRYLNADGRHIFYSAISGPIDSDSNQLHLAHRAWNILAALELTLRNK